MEAPTINKIIAALKKYFKFAMDTQLTIYNPMSKVTMKRIMAQYTAPRWLYKQDNTKFFHDIEQNKNEKRKAKDCPFPNKIDTLNSLYLIFS
ncbi:hypothetical protein [Desnuesiella massiliensis]|uniref:hypothetical protein n=1 Tax=Desnuesiella massiliensis TaxID=1650662 RepID=UPI0006E43F8D|nr:hypothetical protein [Desnuesiella massiliensis]